MIASTFLSSTALFASILSLALAQAPLTINTPTGLVTCEPSLLTWSGGVAPYFVTVLQGSQPAAAPLEQLGTFTGTNFKWVVNLPGGTLISLQIKDSTGTINFAQAVTIQSGTTTSCPTSSNPIPAGASTSSRAGGQGGVTTSSRLISSGSARSPSTAVSSVVPSLSAAGVSATPSASPTPLLNSPSASSSNPSPTTITSNPTVKSAAVHTIAGKAIVLAMSMGITLMMLEMI